ncbi:MAG: RNA polymerase sigma factor [Gammaproteobacteria bacterium]|nr:RNA polymerase sigma factor [Gammaproteobacteria bacterium]
MDEQVSDEELMLLYRGGDAGAFERLYLRNKDKLYRFMLRQCGHESIVEELFQDVWMKLIQARHRYQPTAGFRTYLYRIARNRIIDHYRNSCRSVLDKAGSEPGVLEALPATPQQQPEEQLAAGEQLESLLLAIEQLPAEQRETFLLREEAGMSVQEIAVITGINPETVKSRLRYALRKIRTLMVTES